MSSSPKRKRNIFRRLVLLLVALVVILGLVLWWLPSPKLSPSLSLPSVSQTKVVLPWPGYGEAAIGALGFGLIQSHGTSTMLPTASVAKIITILTVFNQKPLSLGQQGPTITLGPSDVAYYEHYAAIGGSVVKVVPGETISEYQVIQAMLLPSANNMADSLATWAFGSLPAYVSAANQYLKSDGLKNTIVSDDASGYLPRTKSTASDLTSLGEIAMNNPVIKQIVGQKQADLPVAGEVNNVNWLLGTNGVIGIKTGNTDQAGGVYLFAVDDPVDPTTTVDIVGSIMGAPSLARALIDSVPLINAAKSNFQDVTLVKAGQRVGYYKLPWNDKTVSVVAKSNLTTVSWIGQIPALKVSLNNISAPLSQGRVVGTIVTNQQFSKASVPAVLGNNVNEPSWKWRFFRVR